MSEKYWLVVQYPLKSAQGSKRDHWLKEKIMEYLETVLTQAELGEVDGCDLGSRVADPKAYVMNIFCVVTDEDRSIALIKKVLRESRLDYTRIQIATMPYGTEGSYTLKYASKKALPNSRFDHDSLFLTITNGTSPAREQFARHFPHLDLSYKKR